MTSHDAKQNEAKIRAMIEQWAAAVRARDLDAIVADRAQDILMFDVPPPTQLRGIEAYAESWKPFFRSFGENGVWEVGDVAVHAGEDVAFATALVRCCGEDAKGEREELAVRLTIGLRKQGGEWKVVHEHHSVAAT